MSTQERSSDRKNAAPRTLPSSSDKGLASVQGVPLAAGVVQRMATTPQQTAPHDVLYLQRTAGNRAVTQLLGRGSPPEPLSPRPVIQASLKVGKADDRYEREADQIAGSITTPGSSRPVKAHKSGTNARISRLQRAPVVGSEGGVVGSAIESRLRASKNSGSPLADNIRRTIEPKLGADLSGVKVHTGKEAVQLNRDLGAKAFTHQNHIYYGEGQSPSDLQLTAHEAVHTVQQGAVNQVQRAGVAISSNASGKIQRKFGFEVEVPLFLTYTDPAATGADANKRNDAMEGSDGGVAWHPASPNFDIKVDHNIELNPLAAHEYNTNRGMFPSGASIVELVSKPWDEFALTEKQVRERAKEMADWAKAKYKVAKNGQTHILGGYYIGSNMPGAIKYQSTLGYIQATYGVKLSSIPEAFRQTTLTNPNIPDPKKPTATVHDNLLEANRVAAAVMQAIRIADAGWDANVPAPESNSLQGFITLLANYLLAGKGGGVGLAKNMIGQFFYKSDMGKMALALPQPVKTRLGNHANGSRQALYNELLDETGRDEDEEILPEMDKSVQDWISDVLFGRKDELLDNMKNEYSSEYGPDYLGVGPNVESSVVMENRELQYLDPKYNKKKKKFDKEWESYKKKNAKSKTHTDKSKLQQALAKMTDPKKYPTDKWGDMFVLVYRMVKQLNSMGTTQMVPP